VRSPFRNPPAPARDEDYLWLRPAIVAEVSTPGGAIRHAAFEGLREDRPARAVAKEPAIDSRRVAYRAVKATNRR
jgi:bifunctional non-homologous end joining protein LigD